MRRRLLGGSLLAAFVVATGACGAPEGPSSAASSSSSTPSTSVTSKASPTSTKPSAGLARDVRRVVANHPDADIALAYAPVGGGVPVVVGDAPPLVAWSTIKVPLALAVVRAGDGERLSTDITSALTASDNEAAARLWESLGDGASASGAVEEQLRRGGDRRTGVPSRVVVEGYSPFGQATWRLTDQTRMTSALPCLSGSRPVTTAMGQVVDGQRWGLGGIAGARYKGGWGSTPEGYVVRQLGIVPGEGGRTAVTLQVRTGTHAQGTAIADQLAQVVRRHRDELPAGACS